MNLSLCPPLKQQFFFPGTSIPLSGGFVWVVQAGTTGLGSPTATYTDSTGLTLNPNPIILDSNGQCSIWLPGYVKIYVFLPTDTTYSNPIYSIDNVSSQADIQFSSLQWVPQGQATYISPTQFSMSGNETSIFSPGTAVQATIAGGLIYGIIQSSSVSGTPQVTTVTVSWFLTGLDSSFTSVSTGLVSGGVTGSVPLLPPIVIPAASGTYTLTYASVFQTFIIPSTLSANLSIVLPSASNVPPGSFINLRNEYLGSAYSVQITGTVDGITNPWMIGVNWQITSDGTNWISVDTQQPVIPVTLPVGTSAYTLTRNFVIIPSGLTQNLTVTLPSVSAVQPGVPLRIRNEYLGTSFTVQFSGTIDGVSSPYMLGCDWELLTDGTYWYGRVTPVRTVNIAYSANNVGSSGDTSTTWASLQTSLVTLGVPAAARAVFGFANMTTSGTGYLAPVATSTGALSTGYGVVAIGALTVTPWRVVLASPQLLYYLVTANYLDITLTGYEL